VPDAEVGRRNAEVGMGNWEFGVRNAEWRIRNSESHDFELEKPLEEEIGRQKLN
jgi:hypothetical protein